MLLIERALKCVVFIGAVSDPDGFSSTFVPYGTGFVFSVFYEDIRFDYIVTCHHIIDLFEDDNIWIRLNLKDGGSKRVSVSKDSWISDPIQDISILSQPIGDLFDVTRILERDVITKKVFNEWDQHYSPISAGELTFLVGLFTSHYSNIHNQPIVRYGNIASIPEELIYTETGYVKGYLVETRSIGGLSGSPVFLFKASCVEANEGEIDSLFLGMMRGRLITTDINDIVRSSLPERKSVSHKLPKKFQEILLKFMEEHSLIDEINTGIGVVIPSEVIMDFINRLEFVEQREKTVAQLKKRSHLRPSVAIPVIDNPQHKEDFTSLVSAAAKKKPPDDKT